MLNRYQEALNNVKRVYVESEHYDEEDIRLLQELVDKATPKKVDKYSRHKDLEPTCFCPLCENIVEKEQKHCPECGQKLDFKE